MQGTATISLTEYNSMRDSITELQSLSEKYAEQIQKEQLDNVKLKEYVMKRFLTYSQFDNKYFIYTYKFAYLNDLGFSNYEIYDYLVKVNK